MSQRKNRQSQKRPTRKKKTSSARNRARKMGFRSIFEFDFSKDLQRRGIVYEYESHKIPYEIPARVTRYVPDFYIKETDIYIETKGRMSPKDRTKHLLIREQHPDLDIRFVLQNPRVTISPNSKTTVGDWLTKKGFLWSHKVIPIEWLTKDSTKIKKEHESD